MSFVEPPVPLNWDPQAPRLLLECVERPYRAGEERGVGHLRQDPLVSEQPPRLARFLLAGGGEVNVPPAREAVLQVPEALAMADQYKCRHGSKPTEARLTGRTRQFTSKFLDTLRLKFAMMGSRSATVAQESRTTHEGPA